MPLGRVIHFRGPRSVSGHAIRGDKIVRFIYLDEAGLSKADEEPILVVAGVIVNPDAQWKKIDAHLMSIVADIWPSDGIPERFVFHAKDIWHGSRQFNRKEWTKIQRLRLLQRLASIPSKFSLPIVFGAVDKQRLADSLRKEVNSHNMNLMAYGAAFHTAIRCAENWMKRNAKKEAAMLMIENSPKKREMIKMLHGGYSFPYPDGSVDGFVSNHIIDAPNMIEKEDSTILQIADHCAFLIKRKLIGKADTNELYKMIEPQVHLGLDHRSGAMLRVPVDRLELIASE